MCGCSLLFVCGGCQKNLTASRDFFAMDTVISLTANGEGAEQTLIELQALITESELLYDRTDPASALSTLNEQKTLSRSESPSLYAAIERALDIARLTDTAFDPTVGRFTSLWRFDVETPSLPAPEVLEQTKAHVGLEHLQCTEDTVTLTHDIALDLGGIAKGIVTDEAIALCKDRQITDASLSLGGNVYVLGQKEGRPWKVGIADPLQPDALLGYLSLSDKAVVTSGDYQRSFEKDGILYHHILDPTTGMPANTDLHAVTVVCDSATLADGLSTALFVMGYEKGAAWLSDHPDIEALWVTTDREILCTEGLSSHFTYTAKERYRYHAAEQE